MNWLLLLWLQRHKPNRNMASGPCHRHAFSSRMGPGSYHSGQDVKGGFRFLRTQKEGWEKDLLQGLCGPSPALSLDGSLPATLPFSGHEMWWSQTVIIQGFPWGNLPCPCPPQLLCWSLFNRTFCTSSAFPSSLHNKPCAWELTNYFWAHVLVLTRLVPPHQGSMSESHQAALGFVDGPGLWCAHTHAHTLSPVHPLSLSLLYTHLYIHTPSLSPVHTHTHTHTHTSLPAPSCQLAALLSPAWGFMAGQLRSPSPVNWTTPINPSWHTSRLAAARQMLGVSTPDNQPRPFLYVSLWDNEWRNIPGAQNRTASWAGKPTYWSQWVSGYI